MAVSLNEDEFFEYLGRLGDYKQYSVSVPKSPTSFNKIKEIGHAGTTSFIQALEDQKREHQEKVEADSDEQYALFLHDFIDRVEFRGELLGYFNTIFESVRKLDALKVNRCNRIVK